MKNPKVIIALIVLIIIAGIAGVYLREISKVDNGDQGPIIVDGNDINPDNNTEDSNNEDTLILTEEDAMQLATEQLDMNNFTISLAQKGKEIDGAKYYLFDVVNKSGPSFSTQLAVNQKSGEIMAFEPNEETLKPMNEFPVETPIAAVQDWNGVFVPTDDSTASEGLSIELLQADSNSFEFDVRHKNGKETSFYDVAQISGARASYKSETGYEIIFVKNGDSLKITERGISPIKGDGIVLQGDYKLQ